MSKLHAFVQDYPRKIAALFEALDKLDDVWFDYCQSEGKEVPEAEIYNVIMAYFDMKTAVYEENEHNYAALPLAFHDEQ